MKRFIKNNFLKIFIGICMSFIIIEIGTSAIQKYERNETFVGKIQQYEFFNYIKPEKIAIDKIKNFDNIIPFKIEVNKEIYNTKKINEIIKEILKKVQL